MKKTILILSIIALTATFAQAQQVSMYVVNDPDGWVNLRNEAETDSDVERRLRNKTVVVRNPDRPVSNGWIPIRVTCSSQSRYHGYIHQGRLMPLAEPYASKLLELWSSRGTDEFSDDKMVYVMSLDIPNLFISHYHSGIDNVEYPTIVKDLKTDRIILEANIPNSFGIIWNDTLSFYDFDVPFNSWYRMGNTHLNPMLVIYKLYEKNGEYDFYTEIYPEPRRVSKEEAEQIVKNIRNVLVYDLDGEYKDYYHLPDFYESCRQLFLAYCSGVDEAKEIIKKVYCEEGQSHDFNDVKDWFDAYDRSKKGK